jgi:L-amino acid N-acyltransferase YncA
MYTVKWIQTFLMVHMQGLMLKHRSKEYLVPPTWQVELNTVKKTSIVRGNKVEYKPCEMKESDWDQVANIYLEGIKTGVATFTTEVPTFENWDNSHISSCRLVVRSGDNILGWAALSPTSSRCVYAGVAEVSIYIGEKYNGQGIGTALLTSLIKASEENGFWTLQSGIIRENIASIELHKKCGFREIGIREKVGKMNDKDWLDVVMMERRSNIVGID